MIRSLSSTPRLAGLAALALSATALAMPMTSVAPASAAKADPNSLQAANDKAATWIANHGSQVKLAKGDKLVRSATFEGGNNTVAVAYERLHQGLPVIGGDFVVVTGGNGAVLNTEVAQSAPVDVASTTPALTPERALEISRGQVDAVEGVEPTTLVIWQDGAISRLAYETTVSGQDAGEASRQSVYVDAQDGSVLGTKERVIHGSGNAAYSGPNPLTFATSGSGSSFNMTDPSSPTLRCQDAANNTTFTGPDDVWGNGNGTSRETGCVDALYGAQQMKGMLSSWLGRNGMNGSGGWVPIRVGLNDVNAYYDGTQVQIGHSQTGGRWISSIDVLAHEFGHGVDDKTPGGISGNGTQEFVGDVFATATEFYDNQSSPYDVPDYTIGEEVDLVGSGPIRNMANPAAVGDPSCYTSSIPSAEVHAAAGPGDHWFYLLANGGTSKCDSTVVTGIGVQAATKVMYNAMLSKTSSSSYLKYRTWTLTAAKNLDSTCAQFNAVKNAWDAVNVPAQSADPTCSGGGSTTVTVTNPGSQTGTVGTAKSVQMTASPSGTYTWSATGLPAGLSINASSGLISGTPTTAGSYSSTVTASNGTTSGSATFSWTISGSGGGGSCSGSKLTNGGFESGSTGWTASSGVITTSTSRSPRTGSYYAWLDGYGSSHTDTLSQSVTLPAGCSATLTFYLHVDTAETTTSTAYDKLTVKAGSTTLATYSNLNAATGYTLRTLNLSSFAGQTVTLTFTGTEDVSLQTSFTLDDAAVTVS